MVHVGIAEMGHEGDFIDLGQGVQPCVCRTKTLGCEAQTVHAAVHFQKDAVTHLGFVSCQPVDLFVTMHGMPDGQARAHFQITRLEHAFEQQNRAAPAQLAYALGFFEVQHGKAVGRAQAFKQVFDTVAVSVGFDHGPQFGIGDGLPYPLQIVANGFRMDGGKDWTGHGFSQSDQWDSGTDCQSLRDITASHLPRDSYFLGIGPAGASYS